MKTLIIGYGNESRNDDGVGWFVIAELAKFSLPGGTLETVHQLEVDIAEDVRDYDQVIFVDAAIPESFSVGQTSCLSTPPAERRDEKDRQDACPTWSCEEVGPGFASHAVAHFLTPSDVLGLCRMLYGRAPRGLLYSIRGHDFNFGTALTPETRQAADEVIGQIVARVAAAPLPETICS